MQQLIDKIDEYTTEGSPGVGQLIELNELARTYGVSKVQLEKRIAEALEKRENSSFKERNDALSSKKKDHDTAVDIGFREEMSIRNEKEKPKTSPITFDNVKVEFPELKVEFERGKKDIEVPKPNIDPIQSVTPSASIEFTPKKVSESKEEKKPSLTFEASKNVEKATKEEEKQKEYIERIERALAESERTSAAQKTIPKKKSRPQKKKTVPLVTLRESKAMRTTGIIAIVTSFILPVIGLGAGIYGLTQSAALQKKIGLQPKEYGQEIVKNVKNGNTLCIIGVGIGAIRMLSWIGVFF